MQIKTSGELRGFLADILVGIKNGTVDPNQANAISKIASQINQSLSCEVQAAILLGKMDGTKHDAGKMIIAEHEELEAPAETPVQAVIKSPVAVQLPNIGKDKTWCTQCEQQVTTPQAVNCRSDFCKAKAAA